MTLIEFPGNNGKVFAIDPVHVTAVKPYRSTMPGRGAQLFDMSAVWIDNRTLFVCSWSPEHVLEAVNAARQPLRTAFAAGYGAAVGAHVFGEEPSTWEKAFDAWTKGELEE